MKKEEQEMTQEEKEEFREKLVKSYQELANKEKEKKNKGKHVVILLNHTLSVCLKLLAALIVLTFVGALIYAFAPFHQYNQMYNPSLINNLSNMYGNHFKVIDKESNIDRKGNGTYRIQYKPSPNLVFNAYKNKNDLKNDFPSQFTKYYFENCDNSEIRELLKKFKFTETYEEYAGISFLHYSAVYEIEKYSQFEDALSTVKTVKEYLCSINRNIYYDCDVTYKLGGYCASVYELPGSDINHTFHLGKRNYISYLKKVGTDEKTGITLSQIPEEDLVLWCPDKLYLTINGKDVEPGQFSSYTIPYISDIENYSLSIVTFAPFFQNYQILKDENDANKRLLLYQDKLYEIGSSEITDQKVPYSFTLDEFESFFNVEIRKDYEKERVYIDIKQ